MAERTGIEWTDATWNPTTGCDRVSSGCDNCYALTMAKRLKGMGSPKYQNDGDPRTSGLGFLATEHADALDAPLGWRTPRRVFVNSMSDLFHHRISDEFIARVFVVMAATPQHTYQILTKRHGRMRSLLSSPEFQLLAGRAAFDFCQKHKRPPNWTWPLPNVWLGVSVETQVWADIRIPALLDTPAAVRFLSCEPLLGPIDLGAVRTGNSIIDCLQGETWQQGVIGQEFADDAPGVDWVIVGGESGDNARPMHPDWARRLRDQCAVAGVPFHFKQWGAWGEIGPLYGEGDEVEAAHNDAVHLEVVERREVVQLEPDGTIVNPEEYQPGRGTWLMARVGKKAAGRVLDGRTHDDFPAVGHA